ncbi:MAG TPA: hypothetical protein VFE16_07120 [Candidatus Cybelea sp.]|nr:hypothetical protein [Candidatus Cybelea sp.]
MRSVGAGLLAVMTLIATAGASGATNHDLSDWFYAATAANQSRTVAATITPDFLSGKTMRSMHCGGTGVSIGSGIWQLVKYDRKHEIGLAVASTDQCSVAVFKASPPSVTVPDADLSQVSTGRGVRIGSSYSELLATYGGKPKPQSARFVVPYAATVPSTSVTHPSKHVDDPETITFVIEKGRVSAITVSVDLGGEF